MQCIIRLNHIPTSFSPLLRFTVVKDSTPYGSVRVTGRTKRISERLVEKQRIFTQRLQLFERYEEQRQTACCWARKPSILVSSTSCFRRCGPCPPCACSKRTTKQQEGRALLKHIEVHKPSRMPVTIRVYEAGKSGGDAWQKADRQTEESPSIPLVVSPPSGCCDDILYYPDLPDVLDALERCPGPSRTQVLLLDGRLRREFPCITSLLNSTDISTAHSKLVSGCEVMMRADDLEAMFSQRESSQTPRCTKPASRNVLTPHDQSYSRCRLGTSLSYSARKGLDLLLENGPNG